MLTMRLLVVLSVAACSIPHWMVFTLGADSTWHHQHMVSLQFTDPKLGTELKFNVMDFKGPTVEPEDNRMSSMLDSAKIFSEIWETGVSSC